MDAEPYDDVSTEPEVDDGAPELKNSYRKVDLKPPTPMQSLLLKLDQWLMSQPEWPLLFLAGRNTRREAARQVSKHILTMPSRKRLLFEEPEGRKG